MIPRRTTLKFEYLREFEPEFENVLGYELGAHMGSIHEENQGPKLSLIIWDLRITLRKHVTTTATLIFRIIGTVEFAFN